MKSITVLFPHRVTSLPAFLDQDVVVHIPEDAEGTEINHLALYCRSNNVSMVQTVVLSTPETLWIL